MVIIGIIIKSFTNAVEEFSREAILPSNWEMLFYNLNNRRDKKNRTISGLKKPNILIDKNQPPFALNKEKMKVNTPEDDE